MATEYVECSKAHREKKVKTPSGKVKKTGGCGKSYLSWGDAVLDQLTDAVRRRFPVTRSDWEYGRRLPLLCRLHDNTTVQSIENVEAVKY